ncbi:MAG: hypothetical protein MAG471_00410 [Acidimicrobiaceae bacterium]|nr:hypothetical protein [Acidimicrobiaceae bacterium]
MDASEALGAGEGPTPCTRGNQEAVVALGNPLDVDGMRRHVQGRGPLPQAQVQVEARHALRLAEGDPVDIPVPCKELLGEGWPVVWHMGFVPNEGETALEAVTTEGLRCPQAGK